MEQLVGMSSDAAVEAATNYWALLAIVAPFGIFLFVCGLLVYAKRFLRFLVVDRVFSGKPSLAITYLGLWIVLVPLSHFVNESGNEMLMLSCVAGLFGCFAIGVGGMFWMPKFLQPKWMKEMDKLEARAEDPYTRRVSNREKKQ